MKIKHKRGRPKKHKVTQQKQLSSLATPPGIRYRQFVYALRPLFRRNLKSMLINWGWATAANIEDILDKIKDKSKHVVKRYVELWNVVHSKPWKQRLVDYTPEARRRFLDVATNSFVIVITNKSSRNNNN